MNEYENFKNMAVSRGQAILEKWAEDPRIELSEGGKNWLIAALDPFHDTILPQLQGYPDVSTGASVVQTVRQSIEVSATSGGNPPVIAPWDMHIGVVPTLLAEAFTQSTERINNGFKFDATSVGSMPFGGLMARAVFNSGTNVEWWPVGGLGNTVLGNIQLDPAYNSGLSRIIGIGFEVIDTTAVIARQGSCAVYRQCEPERQPTTWVGLPEEGESDDNRIRPFIFSGVPMREPPANLGDAMLLAGSRQWAAEKGCYCVGALHSNSNPPQPVSYTKPVWFQATTEDIMTADHLSTVNSSPVRVPTPIQYPTINVEATTDPAQAFSVFVDFTAYSTTPTKIYPFHQFGAIFSGLSPTSTFRINMNIYVEQFPSVSNKTLIVMATPSLRFDPMALQIYSKALAVLPVGVPVAENGLGTWFAELVHEIEPFVTPLITAFNPALGAISRGAGVASRTYLNRQKPQKSLMVTAPGGKNRDLGLADRQTGVRKNVKKKNQKLSVGNRGKNGRIQGPTRGGMPQMPR